MQPFANYPRFFPDFDHQNIKRGSVSLRFTFGEKKVLPEVITSCDQIFPTYVFIFLLFETLKQKKGKTKTILNQITQIYISLLFMMDQPPFIFE